MILEKTAKIYLVEDEAITALFMKNQLKKIGYVIQKTFARGEDAVSGCQEEKPDLLLMDINLAGVIDGIEAVKKINLINTIPVIFVTGYSNAEVRDRALELHPVAFLIKPVDINDLKDAIEIGLECKIPKSPEGL
jgi:CheY-like chemotaxis protein